jgi:uncharacterized protein
MSEPNPESRLSPTYTTFDGYRRIAAASSLRAVALTVKHRIEAGGSVLIFDDVTGRAIDIDIRGSDDEVVGRLPMPEATSDIVVAPLEAAGPRGRGRPKLGVVAREVTLLPRHWEWLATQPGGASVALRKLVEEARRTHADKDRQRQARERAYNFMSDIAGDMPGFEEASRALFASHRARFSELVAAWPEDVRDHVSRLAFGDEDRDASAKASHLPPSA